MHYYFVSDIGMCTVFPESVLLAFSRKALFVKEIECSGPE